MNPRSIKSRLMPAVLAVLTSASTLTLAVVLPLVSMQGLA
jgi:hypothetical protein